MSRRERDWIFVGVAGCNAVWVGIVGVLTATWWNWVLAVLNAYMAWHAVKVIRREDAAIEARIAAMIADAERGDQ